MLAWPLFSCSILPVQLLLIFAVLVAFLTADVAPSQPVDEGLRRVLLACCAMGLVALFAQILAGATAIALQHDFSQRARVLHRFSSWRRIHVGLWLLCTAGILFGLQWARIVRSNWDLAGTFMVDDLLILLPIVLPLLLSWAAYYEVDRVVDQQISQANALASNQIGRLRYVLLHARHHLGLLLIPLLLILGVQDAMLWLVPASMQTMAAWVVYLPALIGLIVALPWLLKQLWPTEPLAAGPLRSQLETIGRQLKVRTSEILVWRTERMICNAAVAGVVPSLRYVFLSDVLFLRMSNDEVAAIYAHELGHVRHHHLPLRVLAALLPISLWHALQALFPEAIRQSGDWLIRHGIPETFHAALLVLVGMGGYAVTILSWYSKKLEHEADLDGCRAMSDSQQMTAEGTELFIAALTKLSAASSQRRPQRTWLHPSVEQRVAFVRRMLASQAEQDRFHRRLRRLARLGMAVVATAILVPMLLALAS